MSRSICMMSLEETRPPPSFPAGKPGRRSWHQGHRPRPVPSCHPRQGALGPPWECVLPKPPFFSWEAGDSQSADRGRGTSVRACAKLLSAGGDGGSAWVGGDRGSAHVGRGHGDVVPKITNPRNHYGADTDANTQGLISKLEFASKFTRHSGAGTWTSWWVFA